MDPKLKPSRRTPTIDDLNPALLKGPQAMGVMVYYSLFMGNAGLRFYEQ